MSVNAYKRSIRENETPRQIEARVFSRITGGMAAHLEAWNAAADRAERVAILSQGLRDLISENRALWVRLQNDLASEFNQLPPALRANLISISLWVDRSCGEVIGGGDGLAALIDINRNIITGLTGQAMTTPSKVQQHGTESYAQAV